MLAGPIPVTILRAAQFHEFVGQIVEWGRQGDVSYVPEMRTQLVAATWKPYRIYDYGQPVFMNTKDSATALQTMEAASDQLATRLKEPTTSPIPSLPPAPPYAPQSPPKA